MRVLLDARPLQGSTGGRGVGVYVRTLGNGLLEADRSLELRLLVGRGGGAPLRPPSGERASLEWVGLPPIPDLWWGRLRGPAWSRNAKADVVHATFVAPPRSARGVPVVATVHDLIPLRHPERFSARQRHVFKQSIRLAARANRVICVSEFTADLLRREVDMPAGRVHVIPPAVEVTRFSDPIGRGLTGVVAPYVLHLGGFDPLKGVIDLLLPAFAWLAKERSELQLALTGSGPGRGAAESAVRELGLDSRVCFTGQLEEKQHAAAIAGACALVVSSWEEGFGIPAIEALAAGVPVAVGPSAATREVVSTIAVLADGDSPDSLAAAIKGALGQGGSQSEDGGRRRKFAARFAPVAVAEQVLAVYRAAIEESSSAGSAT